MSPNKSLYFWEIGGNFFTRNPGHYWEEKRKYYPESYWPMIAREKHNPQLWYIKNRCRKLLIIEDFGKEFEIEISDRKTRGRKARCISTPRCETSLSQSLLLDFLGISKPCLSLHNTSVSRNYLYSVTQSTLMQYFVVGRKKQKILSRKRMVYHKSIAEPYHDNKTSFQDLMALFWGVFLMYRI